LTLNFCPQEQENEIIETASEHIVGGFVRHFNLFVVAGLPLRPTSVARMTGGNSGELLMAKTNQRVVARKPATKYPNLQKKLQEGKVKAGAAKKK
jgi:hypothetical protein